MEFKFFTDLIDALGKVVSGLKAIINLPRAERDAIRRTLDETYRLIDTTLNMVIIRLGDILLQETIDDFLSETARLDNYNEWMQAEREFRLCRSLRVVLREAETLTGKLPAAMSMIDWEALLKQMQRILTAESELARFIGEQFQQLAGEAYSARQDSIKTKSVRDTLTAFRSALVAERQELIRQELELFNIV
ncbi:MAG: hypothetical protein V2B19_28690 [Pseudomonadota bacterium]